jgi:hypothetical protein
MRSRDVGQVPRPHEGLHSEMFRPARAPPGVARSIRIFLSGHDSCASADLSECVGCLDIGLPSAAKGDVYSNLRTWIGSEPRSRHATRHALSLRGRTRRRVVVRCGSDSCLLVARPISPAPSRGRCNTQPDRRPPLGTFPHPGGPRDPRLARHGAMRRLSFVHREAGRPAASWNAHRGV